MRLSEYVGDRKGEKRGLIAELSKKSGLAYNTVHAAAGGELLKTYAAAKALSEATGGAVSIAELCEQPTPEPNGHVVDADDEPETNGSAVA